MSTPIPENNVRFSLEEVLQATQGKVKNGSPQVELGSTFVQGVCLDSRRVRPENLFVALEGENHDAHEFIQQVVDAGASAILVHKSNVEVPPHVITIEVKDTLIALGDLGCFHRKRWGGRLVAVTGSAGKTSTRTMVASVLSIFEKPIAQTLGNLNNLIGVPMMLFTLDSEALAVVEIGTSHPGEIARLTQITQPNVGLITLVSSAHSEGLGGLKGVLKEKTALWNGLNQEAIAVGLADDPSLMERLSSKSLEKQFTFGKSESATVQLLSNIIQANGKTKNVFKIGEHLMEACFSLLGESAAMNAAAALAVFFAFQKDMSHPDEILNQLHEALENLANLEPIQGRLFPRVVPHDVLMLDDSYNANPKSAASALCTASELAKVRGGKLWVAMGDMKELGEQALSAHLKLLAQAEKAHVKMFIGYGELLNHAIQSKNTSAEIQTISAQTHQEIAEILLSQANPRDVILVKGSRSMHMERVVSSLSVQEVSA